jgi:hypothetical protein
MTKEEIEMLCGYSKEELAEQLLTTIEIIRQRNKQIDELKNDEK